ncbi:MAG: ABC transporter permease [Pseudomonadota bacterium]
MGALHIAEVIGATAVASGTPILLAGLGELVAEKAGVLNLGVEGMMLVGALTGFAAAHASGSAWVGVGVAAAAAGAFALLHALPVVLLRVNQVVSGLALVILGGGLASSFGRPFVGQVAPSFHDVAVPYLSAIPLVGPIFFRHDPLVYLGLALALAVGAFLRWTRPGLGLAVCGENPRLADAAGLRVALIRVLATVFGGTLAGVGGAWLSLADTPSWVDGMTAGRGWIAVAMVIFAGWSPGRLALGAWLFGGLVAVQFRIQAFGFDANVYVLKMLPYLLTLAVLVAATRGPWRHRLGAPAALGKPWAREERE